MVPALCLLCWQTISDCGFTGFLETITSFWVEHFKMTFPVLSFKVISREIHPPPRRVTFLVFCFHRSTGWRYNTMYNIHGEVWKIRLILILGKLGKPASLFWKRLSSLLVNWKDNTELHNPTLVPLPDSLFPLYFTFVIKMQQLYWVNQNRWFCHNFSSNISNKFFSYLWQIQELLGFHWCSAAKEFIIIFNRSSATYRKKSFTSIISLCLCTTWQVQKFT